MAFLFNVITVGNFRAKIMPKLIMQTLIYNIDIVLSKLLGFRLVSQSQPNLVIKRDKGNILMEK